MSLVILLLVPTDGECADFWVGLDAYGRADYTAALREWLPLAEEGDPDAQLNLGWIFDKGHGIVQNHKTAAKWFTLAAHQGEAMAQHYLSMMYFTGRGVSQNYVLAHMWSIIAASNGKKHGAKKREVFAQRMTNSQIQEAVGLARRCLETEYEEC